MSARQQITCTQVGSYGHALTRGKQYEMLDHKEETGEVRVRGDNSRTRWYSTYYFDLSGAPVISLKRWKFDDLVDDPLNDRNETYNWVDVTMELDDGSRRWCSFMTPDFLKSYLAQPGAPVLCSPHILFVRDLRDDTVEEALLHLEENNELFAHTLPLENNAVPDGDEDYL